MEEDKKKKKNKKKKNKHATKPTESVTLDAKESTPDHQSHVLNIGHDNNGQVSTGAIDALNDVGRNSEVDRDGHLVNGSEAENLAKVENQHWLDREASFQEKMNESHTERDTMIQKEATQEEKVKQLHDEKNASMQKENSLKEKIIQLEKEKDALIQKEGSLEQRMEQLQREKDSHLQKEATLESKILQLESEKDSWLQKEAGFKEKINHLVDEAAVLNLKGVSLQEKIKQMERERDTWILSENLTKESITSLGNENTTLRAQVTELEQSRNILLEETQQLTENISNLQLQIKNLESTAGFSHPSTVNEGTSEDADMNHQTEASGALVEKLITENSELVRKVNALYAELDQRTEDSFPIGSAPGPIAAQSADIADSSVLPPNLAGPNYNEPARAADSISEANKMMPVSGSTQSLEDVMIEDQSNGEHVNDKYGSGLANSSEIIAVDEIVQIPLHENEAIETNLEVAQNEEKTDVPLTEAPLIGAPFRFISFFARYVSGADLVNKNSGNSI
ncbi:hypothetical protein ACJIZ3_024523 [Penstemon smallii]|uniref:Uncharacterized protein n=1 Tax=Penstemon smallii TaxID=265156 RepID=A0ABD3TUK7_9LAMI